MSLKTTKPVTKRGNGSGSVRKLPSGTWQWRASVTLPNGLVQRLSGTAKTKTEAKALLSSTLTDAARGELVVSSETTIEQYLRTWFALRSEQQAVKYSSAQQSLIDKHIAPGIGHLKLTSLTARHLQAFYAQLQHRDQRRPKTLGQPLSDSSKRQIHNLLHLALAEAVRHGDLHKNPVDLVRPRYTRQAAQDTTLKAWTPEEAQRFYHVARTDRWGVIFCFMISTGLRIGEALGLRWESVNLDESQDKGQIVVKEALVSVRGKMLRTTPKTARSWRTLPISGDALTILKERPEQEKWDREAAGAQYVGSDSVFTNTLGKPILPDNVYRLMKQLCAKADVPYLATHVARHTFTSMLGVQGVPIEVVSAHLGHAKPSFTLDRYRTVFKSEQADITLDFSIPHVPKAKK